MEWLLGGIATFVFWLLRNKDAVQAKQIDDLIRMHNEDAKRLQDLELEIARKHYVKDELDAKFDKLEDAFKIGFELMGTKFDRLSNALMKSHIAIDVK
jgi:hypothetical protein